MKKLLDDDAVKHNKEATSSLNKNEGHCAGTNSETEWVVGELASYFKKTRSREVILLHSFELMR